MISRTTFLILIVATVSTTPSATLAGESPNENAPLDEIVRRYPIAGAQVDTLLDDLARLEYDLRISDAEGRARADSLIAENRYLHWQVDYEQSTSPPWYDSFIVGYAAGALFTILVVAGLRSL